MFEDWRNTFGILMYITPGGRANRCSPVRSKIHSVQTVLLHIKSKVMTSRRCKILPGGMSGSHQRSKSRIWGPFFFDCHTTPPRVFELEPLKLSQVVTLWMKSGGTYLEFWCAWRYAMVLARGYVMARHPLALVTGMLLKVLTYLSPLKFYYSAIIPWKQYLILKLPTILMLLSSPHRGRFHLCSPWFCYLDLPFRNLLTELD